MGKRDLDNAITRPYYPLRLINIGNGSAFNIVIIIEEIYNIEGLDNVQDVIHNNIENFYEKCITKKYDTIIPQSQPNQNKLLFTEFSLGKNDVMNFVLNLNGSGNSYTMLKIIFEDSFNNAYMQKIAIFNFIDKDKLFSYPISKIYSLNPHQAHHLL